MISRSPTALWEEVGKRSCVSRVDFDTYFSGLDLAHAIVVDGVEDLGNEFTLSRLRELGFFPPQSWCRATQAVSSVVEGNS